MSTAEILIVFSALMALIALVTIGIDWVGKPLKNRRFIPRMYRFDDEKLPIDEYGNTNFEALDAIESGYQPPYVATLPHPQPGVYPPPYGQMSGYTPLDPADHHAATADVEDRADPTVVVPTQPPPRQVAKLDPALAASSAASRSAFTDSLGDVGSGHSSQQREGTNNDLLAGSAAAGGGLFARSAIAGTGAAQAEAPAAEQAWNPAMALDTTVNDQKPSLATKAERFWMATAGASVDSHFNKDELARMAQGKAPRRINPRNGKTEAMQLTGLRQASQRVDVRMRWPDDAVDPWNAS